MSATREPIGYANNVISLDEIRAKRAAKAAARPPRGGTQPSSPAREACWLFMRDPADPKTLGPWVLCPVPAPRTADQGLRLIDDMRQAGWRVMYGPWPGKTPLIWDWSDHTASLGQTINVLTTSQDPDNKRIGQNLIRLRQTAPIEYFEDRTSA